jgi:hypothetical protein
VGVRTHECPCGYSFRAKKAREAKKVKKAKKAKKEAKTTQPAAESKASFVIMTPSGICPVILDSTEHEDVKDWLIRLRESTTNNGVRYSINAYKYSARSFYNIHSEEYAQIAAHIDTLLIEEGETEQTALEE